MDTENNREAPKDQQRGFATLDPETRKVISSKGGKAAHEKGRAHEFTADEARKAGAKGGQRVSRDREYMAAIGRRGGQRVSRDREYMSRIGRRGGVTVSEDRSHMAEIGRKGGARSHPASEETETETNDNKEPTS